MRNVINNSILLSVNTLETVYYMNSYFILTTQGLSGLWVLDLYILTYILIQYIVVKRLVEYAIYFLLIFFYFCKIGSYTDAH